MRKSGGFTLIELLIVIGIIGFLAAAVLVAVDPVRRIREARDVERWSEVNAVLEAILKKQVDDRARFDGDPLAGIISDAVNAQVIVETSLDVVCNSALTRPGCRRPLAVTNNTACVADLSGLVPTYLAEIPRDPREGQAPCTQTSGCTTEGVYPIGPKNSGYYIHRTAAGRIEIGACAPEEAATITVRR